jgi:hypothetical protein
VDDVDDAAGRCGLPQGVAAVAAIGGRGDDRGRFPGDRGAAGLVSSLALQVARDLDQCAAAEGTRLGTALLDLLTVALATRLDRSHDVPAECRQTAMLQRVRAFIEQRLDDPTLSPGAVAAAHHISVRMLYQLFEQQEETVAAWIRQRRP